jgi:ABC-type multidrug transport system fused ATPase/permease subunit
MNNPPSSRFNRLITLLLEDKKNAILASLLLVAQGIAAAAAPRLLGVAVDSAQSSPVYSMVLIGLGYFLLEAVRIFSTRLQAVEFSKIGQSAVHRLRLQTFHHILSLPWSEVRRLGPSDLLSRLTVDLRSHRHNFNFTSDRSCRYRLPSSSFSRCVVRFKKALYCILCASNRF